jgi:NifU-like protein involved in Fe-S cluster formation
MSAYNAAVTAYFDRPARAGGKGIGAEAGSPAQGAWICVAADVRADLLCNVGFRAFACPHIIAACNWVVERLEGQPAAVLLELTVEELRTKFDIPVEKAGKLLILQDALQACYTDYRAHKAASG